jgi:hypothetical protein
MKKQSEGEIMAEAISKVPTPLLLDYFLACLKARDKMNIRLQLNLRLDER